MVKRFFSIFVCIAVSSAIFGQNVPMTRKGAPLGGNIVDIEVHPTGTVYAVVASNGLFRSTDSGTTWNKVAVSSNNSLNNNFFDIEIDPAGSIFLVTSSSAAMFQSTDNGLTWTQRTGSNPFGDFNYTPRLVERSGTAANSPVYIVTGYNFTLSKQAVFRSIDNGSSWIEVYSEASTANEITGITSTSGGAVVLLVNNKGVVRSATGNVGTFAVSNSSVTSLASMFFHRGSLAFAGSPARLFVNAGLSGLAESTDMGQTWTVTPSLPGTFSTASGGSFIQMSGYGSTLQVYNNVGTTPQLFTLAVPAAGAVAWSNATSAATRSFFTRFYARSATEFYLGETVGFSRSTNGTAWTFSVTGMEGLQFFSSYQNAPLLRASTTGLVIGTNPLFSAGTDGATWTRATGTGLLGTPRGFVQLPSGNWLMIGDQTSVSPNVTNLYVSTDQGATWTPRALATGEGFLNNITSSGNTIYANTSTARVFSSTDEGVTWQQLAITGLPGTFNFNNSNLSFFVMNNTLYMGGNDAGVRYYRVDLTSLAATLIPNPPGAVTLQQGGLRGFGGKLYLTSTNGAIAQLSVSSNNGTVWNTVSVPGVTSATAFLTSSGYPAYAMTSGLVTFTRDDGQTWLTANLGFSAGEFFGIRSVETDPAGLLNVLVDSRGLYQSTAAVVLPANPTNLQVLGSTFNQVRLEWDDNATNESYYRVERSVGNNTSYDSIGTINASNFAAINIFFNVEPQTTYFYRVIAVNGAGRSAYSNEVSVVTPARCATTIPENRSWSLATLNESGLGVRTRLNVSLQLSRLDNFQFTLSSFAGNTPAWAAPNTNLNTATTTLIENCGSVYIFNSNNYTMNGNGTWNAATGKITIKWKVNRGTTSGITPFSETTELTLNPTDPPPAANSLQPFLSVLDDNGIMVSWTGNIAFAQQIAVERAPAATGPWVEVGRVNSPETNYADRSAGLAFGTTYFYRLNFYNASGNIPSVANNSVLFRKPYFAAIEAVPFYPVASKLYTSWVDIDNSGTDELFYAVNSNVNRAGFISNIGQPSVALNEFGNSNLKIYRNIRFGDMNNDGNIDLVCAMQDATVFGTYALEVYHGNGTGGFTLAHRRAPTAVSFSDIALYDFNQDGRLDILTEALVTNTATLTSTSRLSIFQNEGNGNYSQGTDLYSNEPSTNGVVDIALADYDNDGDTDIFLAGIFGTVNHRIFRNNGTGTFTQTPIPSLEINPSSVMQSAAWGDIDNDGDLDLVCAYGSTPATKALFRNDGNGAFTNLTASAVAEPFVAGTTSGILLDVENDGDLDVIVNQQISTPTTANAVLYLNNGTGTYARRTGDGEFLNQSFPGKNQFTAGDFNNDGYLDVALGTSDRYRYILQNNKFTTGNWLKVRLRGVASNRSGIGARIQVLSGARTQIRDVFAQAGGGLNGQHSLVQHFGLASEAGPVTVRVTWPNNKVQVVSNVAINQTLEVIEDTDGPTLAFVPASGTTDVFAGTKLDITTSEDANAVTGKSIFVYLASNTTTAVFTLPATAGVKTGNTFSYTLPARLNQGAQYAVQVEEGAFADAFGNTNATVPVTSWQFTVGAGPVLSSRVPTNGATNVPVNANIELNFDRTITAVAGKRIRVVDGPTTILNVEVSTGTISGTRFTLDPSADLPFERSLQVILDAGAFVDAVQNESAAVAANQYTFTTVVAPDQTAPVINFDAGVLASLEKGFSPINIAATVTDNRNVARVTLFHRRAGAGAATFNTLPLTAPSAPQVNPWTGQIQNSFADDLGFEYYLEAEDAAGNKARLPNQATQFFTARLTFSGSNRPIVNVPGGGSKQSWRIIAIPHELNTQQISEIFSELGPSSKTTWRMLQYSANTTVSPVVESWVEFPTFSTIQRGRGYFINAFEQKEIQLNNAKAPDFSRSKLFELNLVRGWNLIGNPYTVPLFWDDIRTFNNISNTVGSLKLFANGVYTNGNELLPLRGGFVFANEAINNVKFSFQGQTSGGRSSVPVFEGEDWLLPIRVSDGVVKNDLGGIGMHREASRSFDGLDDLTPPAFDAQVEIRFERPEHFMKYFTKDIVPTSNEHEWSFIVRASSAGVAILDWDASRVSIAGDLILYDEAAQVPVDMLRQSAYTFDPSQSSRFSIFYGKDVMSKLKPSRIAAGPVFPSPVSRVATIPFSIPEKSKIGTYSVQLEIFDALGRRVDTILNQQLAAGFYQGTWQIPDAVADGIFIYRLSVASGGGRETVGGKILVKKQ